MFQEEVMSNGNTIKVWDLLIRLFHWTLVGAFIVAYITQEEGSAWHIYSGYIIFALIAFRLLWGIVGTKYARFSSFIYSPKETFNYLKGLINRHPKHYIGHNPAGSWMVIALLISLSVATVSGVEIRSSEGGGNFFATVSNDVSMIKAARFENESDEENEGNESFWKDIHEASANIVLMLIILHILGVVVSSKLHNENLVRSMITGNKRSK